MTSALDPDSNHPAYLCGRLFAVFDRLQYLALNGVNAGVVERFYASASVTPPSSPRFRTVVKPAISVFRALSAAR